MCPPGKINMWINGKEIQCKNPSKLTSKEPLLVVLTLLGENCQRGWTSNKCWIISTTTQIKCKTVSLCYEYIIPNIIMANLTTKINLVDMHDRIQVLNNLQFSKDIYKEFKKRHTSFIFLMFSEVVLFFLTKCIL